MRIDGKQIAGEIIAELEARRHTLPEKLSLGVLMGAGNAATDSFVRIKERLAARLNVTVVRETIGEETTIDHAITIATQMAYANGGVIVQLPLPSALEVEKIAAAVPPLKDPDALNPANNLVHAPVAAAIAEILIRAGVQIRGKEAVVLGAGRLVGAPAAKFLRAEGARVSVVTNTEGELSALKSADLVVLGAGEPGLVRPEMLKPGVVLIDAGTSEAGGRVVGDADPACEGVAALFTPVPGGVGPIVVAMLFKNFFTLVEQQHR